MIEIKEEKLGDFLEEMKPLLLLHWEEVAAFKDSIVFDPNYDLYFEIEKAGGLHCVTVRDDGRLVGYFLSLVHQHLHYQGSKWAINDVLFIHPDHRHGSLAMDMFKFAESKLRDMGCDVMSIHMKTYARFDRLVERLGYENVEAIYAKQLG